MLNNSIIITTERCVITRLCKTDIGEAIKLFTNDVVRCYLGGAITEEQAFKKLKCWVENYNDFYFSVRINDTGEFIGLISITRYHDSEFKELAYQFLPDFWQKGFAHEAIKAILGYIKTLKKYDYLVAETQSLNSRSCRLLEKMGFELTDKVSRFGKEQNVYRFLLNGSDKV